VEAHFAHHYVGEGYDRHIEIDAYPTDEGGVAVFWREVSARVRAEQALRQQNEQLGEQALELELANQQLQDNAAELEAANEELQATAAALEEGTEEAERARAEADAAGRRLAFLAEAGERLASSLDYETTLRQIVALAVPMISDWALYTVDAGDGTLRIVASCHAVPAKEAFIAEIARRYPIQADEPAGAAKVLRTGEPELIPEIPDAVLEAVARDSEHLEMLRAIGFRSLMTVPVSVQGRALGALGFVTGESGRYYGPDDLAFALELARRAATAVDHARLYAEAQAARREAEAERARAAGILESMADAHFVLDADFRFVSANAAMERGVGVPREGLLGRTIWEVFPGTVGTVFERNYRRVAADGVEAHFTGEYDEGGLELVPEVDAYPAPGGGVAVFWRDVRARERAAAALRASEAQLRTLTDALPTLAWTARADGYIDWYNARWYEYTGATPEQMEGWGWQAVHDPAVLPVAMEQWQASIATGAPFEMTLPLRGADGRFRRFLTRVTPLTDAEGRVVRWFGTNTDVEAERAAREAAEGANRAKSDFLATMSHELRTPLNAIAGYAELLEIGIHGPITDPQREAITRIQRSQRHLLSLINDVLNFAKLEAGHVEYRLADVHVREAVDVLEPLVAPQLRAKQLRFDRAGCADGRVVRADGDKLQQILVNLLSNAIKFTPAGGAVTLHCEDRGDVVYIHVRDTGIGIAADRLEAVFAPFVQIDRRLNAPHEGTGLGLAISRDLARGMGGDVTAESVPGEGSTFTLTLPAAH
jgi:PAS domain S-box-containing protein